MRLFIAINLPLEIRSRITQIITQIPAEILPRQSASSPRESTFRWLPPGNWHLTITFLGYQPDEAVDSIQKSIQETADGFNPPLIEFEEIIYGPPNKPARMIWLIGKQKTSQTLSKIKEKLENKLIKNGVNFRQENRQFHTHLTLARFQYGEVEFPKEVQLPKIDCCFEAQSLDLMESRLKRSGAEYESISQFAFGQSVL